MLDFLPEEKRKILLRYPFIKEFLEGKMNAKTFLENLDFFETELISRGIIKEEIGQIIKLIKSSKAKTGLAKLNEFVLIRHAQKEGNSISALGMAESKKLAESLYKEIEVSPKGTIFYILPSMVERAIATSNVIETRLKDLCNSKEDIELVEVKDFRRIKDINKKYLIIGLQASALLGFKEKTPSIPAFLKFKKLFAGNEDLVGMVWAARKEELIYLNEKILATFPNFDVNLINPPEFNETPEQAALKYIILIRRLHKIANDYFPSFSSKGLLIGHNLSADFAAIVLLGQKISVKSIDSLGGRFREYLEPSIFQFESGIIKIRYRNKYNINAVGLEKIMSQLKLESAERKKEWKSYIS